MRSATELALAANALALLALAAISARQLGWLGHLPELPGRTFQTNTLVTSPESRLLGLPDGPPGLASYALTLGLVLRGSPLARYKSAFDLLYGLGRSGKGWLKTRTLCGWCLIALGCSAVSAAALWRER